MQSKAGSHQLRPHQLLVPACDLLLILLAYVCVCVSVGNISPNGQMRQLRQLHPFFFYPPFLLSYVAVLFH
jgi:hypothetical protein